MNAIILYLIESALCVSVLYAIYWFFLRWDTFFSLNRFYLLVMILFSILFPLLPFEWTPSNPSATIVVWLEPVMITPAKVEQTLQSHLQWIEIAGVVYFTGLFVFLFRFGMQLVQIQLITRRFGISDRQGHRVVFVDRGYAPFSFFNLVFIHEKTIPQGSLPAILEHEQIHIRQRHSLDMIVFEVARILQWFNPAIWMAGREMKSIHEFLADEGVLQNGISRSRYQQMILDETMGIRVNDLTNNFNISLLKKRIAMMTKSRSKKCAKGKVLIAAPIFLLLGFLLTAHSYGKITLADNHISRVFTQADLFSNPEVFMQQEKSKQKTQVKYVAPIDTSKMVYKTVEKMPSYCGGDDARVKFLVENIKYPEEAIKKGVQGKVFVCYVVRADGSITDAKVMRGIGSGCDEEALRVVKIMPKWNPGMDKGKAVDVSYVLPIKFALDSHPKDEPKK